MNKDLVSNIGNIDRDWFEMPDPKEKGGISIDQLQMPSYGRQAMFFAKDSVLSTLMPDPKSKITNFTRIVKRMDYDNHPNMILLRKTKVVHHTLLDYKSNLAIAAMAATLSDPAVIMATFLLGDLNHFTYPQKMLWHFFLGNGQTVNVDTGKVLSADLSLRNSILTGLRREVENKEFGCLKVNQALNNNAEWANAIGSFLLPFKRLSHTTVRVKLIKEAWKWSPNEKIKDLRRTEAVHRIMERTKMIGAKEFMVAGSEFDITVFPLVTRARR